MTTHNASSASDAGKALVAHLLRVDMQLARAGATRCERDAICQQIIEQFHDLLNIPMQEADFEQVEAALAQLGSEVAYESADVLSPSQFGRMLWHRFWIGQPVPIAFNDHGHKRVAWGELIKRLVWMWLVIVMMTVTINLMMVGKATSGMNIFGIIFSVMLPVMIVVKILGTPVESLPRVEHWPVDRLRRHRLAAILIIGGSFLVTCGMFPGVYWLISAARNRPAWPVDQGLFLLVCSILGSLGMILAFGDAWRRKRRRCQFEQWAADGVMPEAIATS